jgi:penicillin-binding protein 1C
MKRLRIATYILLGLAILLAAATLHGLRPLPASLGPDPQDIRKVQVRDRHGVPLSVTYENDRNIHDSIPLHDIPPLLQQAFIAAEDRRFFRHHGVDWAARLHAVVQNLRARRAVRGASTITEQAVRLLHPRPRTLWSRWLEGFEAAALERRFSKEQILEFYLNQVPYAARRRGVVQAARYYFDRDLSTLSQAEMLALAVMVRAPGRLDLHAGTDRVQAQMERLAERLHADSRLTTIEREALRQERFELRSPTLPTAAGHFVRFLLGRQIPSHLRQGGRLDTTLDASLQSRAQAVLDGRLRDLKSRKVGDGAALVVDHETGEVLAWVNGGGDSPEQPGSMIDAVLTPRQPGSALKPFLYALALEEGWNAATLIDDSPLASPVGAGLHPFRNYSRQHYGPLRLRDCLGNSLNIPAVRTAQFVGPEQLLERLRLAGFTSLDRDPGWYGVGLALGNGEVTLFELVQAYAALARRGLFRPLTTILGEAGAAPPRRVYSEEAASFIADILSDPGARQLEFGRGSLLNLPVQTAVKTGTSTDYRDAWAVGFNHRYVVGVWMGNLDQEPMLGITGSIGPALVLRSVFAELNRQGEGRRLFLSPSLAAASVCRTSGGRARPGCPSMQEWFAPGKLPPPCGLEHGRDLPEAAGIPLPLPGFRLVQPTPGLQLAMDPRLPDHLEAFPFELPPETRALRIEWLVDGALAGTTGPGENRFLWPLARGRHTALARLWSTENAPPSETAPVTFHVK